MRGWPGVAWLIALLLVPGAAGGRDLWRSGDRALELTGSVREVIRTTNGTDAEEFRDVAAAHPGRCLLASTFADCPAFRVVGDKDVLVSLTRLRTRFDLRWSPRLSATLVYDHELRAGNLATLGDVLSSGAEQDTFLGLEDDIHRFGLEDAADHRRWSHRAYRALLRYEDEHLELRVGRQRIPWGVGRLWNPIDRFNAVPPLAIEQDESPGIDALDLRWRFSGFSYLQAVYAPGTRSADARYAVRFHGVVRDSDVSLVAGVFEEARTFGFDFARNLGDAAVRLEVVFTDPERRVWPLGRSRPTELERFWQVVLSADLNLEVGTGLYLLVEHLYDGNALGFGRGEAASLLPFFESTARPPDGLSSPARGPFVAPASTDLFGGSRVVSSAGHITGLQLGYEITAALRADFLTLYDWEGRSAVLVPGLRFTGFDAFDLTVGIQLFAGGRRSQYGGQDALVYALAEFYF